MIVNYVILTGDSPKALADQVNEFLKFNLDSTNGLWYPYEAIFIYNSILHQALIREIRIGT